MCLREDIANAVPDNRAEWEGHITLPMECDNGFDFPLNGPVFGHLMCYHNATWLPDFLPDCNEAMQPSVVLFQINVILTSRLQNGKPDIRQDLKNPNRFYFADLKRITPTSVCKGLDLRCDTMFHSLTRSDRCGRDRKSCVTPDNDTSYYWLNVTVSSPFRRAWTHEKVYDQFLKNMVENIKKTDKVEGRTVTYSERNADFACGDSTLAVRIPESGEILCRGCSAAHYLDTSRKACVPCPHGYYQDRSLSTDCTACPNMSLVRDEKSLQVLRSITRDRLSSFDSCPIIRLFPNGSLSIKENRGIDDLYAKISRVQTSGAAASPSLDRPFRNPRSILDIIVILLMLFTATICSLP